MTLTAGGTTLSGPVSFGEVGAYGSVAGGDLELILRRARDGRPLGRVSRLLSTGSYTVVAMLRGDRKVLRLFRDGPALPGRARVRVIQSAPELGETNVLLDGRAIGRSLVPGQASPYATVEPGGYTLRATRAEGRGPPLAVRSGVQLSAGVARTAIVVGSAGERLRIVVTSEAAIAPPRAPRSGLGGLSQGPVWTAVLAVAMAAGAAGGMAYTLASRRRGHGS